MALSVRERAAQIQLLAPAARVAGYLAVIAQIAALDAETTAKYDMYVGTGPYSHKLAARERAARTKLNKELDAWFFALSASEQQGTALITTVFDKLAHGRWPLSAKTQAELTEMNARSIQVDPPEAPPS